MGRGRCSCVDLLLVDPASSLRGLSSASTGLPAEGIALGVRALDCSKDPWGWHSRHAGEQGAEAAVTVAALPAPQQWNDSQDWDAFQSAVERHLLEGTTEAAQLSGHCVVINSLSTLITRHTAPQVPAARATHLKMLYRVLQPIIYLMCYSLSKEPMLRETGAVCIHLPPCTAYPSKGYFTIMS